MNRLDLLYNHRYLKYNDCIAVLPILTGAQNPVLRSKTKPIEKVTKEIKKLLKDMEETAKSAEGVGIAAPQVGRSERVCLAMINGRSAPLINPEITWKSEETDVQQEGCLSLPGIWLLVPRATAIAVRYLDEKGQLQERMLKDWDARVTQHEVDHLDGILIVDYQPEEHQTDRETAQPAL